MSRRRASAPGHGAEQLSSGIDPAAWAASASGVRQVEQAAVAAPAAGAGGLMGRLSGVQVGRRRLRTSEVAWLLDKMATTQAAGLPLFRALTMLAGMRSRDLLGAKVRLLAERVGDGSGFGQALAESQEDFGPLVVALVKAGEESGSLDATLARAAELTAANVRLRRKIRTAMLYPAMVAFMTTGLIVALLTFVVPKFATLYANLGSALPALTRMVLGASHQAPLVLGVLGALAAGLVATLRRARRGGRLGWWVDTVKLRVPVIGPLLAKAVQARVAAVLASLLSAGVPLLTALEHAAAVASNQPVAAALLTVRDQVNDGASLSAALAGQDGMFPPLLVQLAAVGEESGELPRLLVRYSATAEEEVDLAAEALTRLVEPLLIVVIGGLVGVFMVALYLPMVDLVDHVK